VLGKGIQPQRRTETLPCRASNQPEMLGREIKPTVCSDKVTEGPLSWGHLC
jgi:hypothetical protein